MSGFGDYFRSKSLERMDRFFLKFVMITIFVCTIYKPVCAQQVNVRSGFVEDSLQIGETIRFYLTATYPKELDVVFPDSTFSYAPFEFDRKSYSTTETDDGISYDSVVYHLTTFEIDRLQSLSLPLFQLNPADCTVHQSATDSILLTHLVPFSVDTIPADKLPLKVGLAYHEVDKEFNYPLLLIIIAALLILMTIGWFVFGKRIKNHYRIKRMTKAHQKFIDTYTEQLTVLKESFSPTTTEATVAYWKKYLEQLEARPYTKLTTRETMMLEKNDTLIKSLKAIDGAIYGHDVNVTDALENLRGYADQRFARKLEEVNHE